MRNTLKRAVLGAALITVLTGGADAAVLTVQLHDVANYGNLSDPSNIVNSYNIGAFSEVVAFSYDVTITAYNPSWLSEASIYISDSATLGSFGVRPASGIGHSGIETFSGSRDLTALVRSFLVGADGILRVEFAESFDDLDGVDSLFNGTLSFTYNPFVAGVPEPASWALMIGGFGLVGGALRRSRRAVAAIA